MPRTEVPAGTVARHRNSTLHDIPAFFQPASCILRLQLPLGNFPARIESPKIALEFKIATSIYGIRVTCSKSKLRIQFG